MGICVSKTDRESVDLLAGTLLSNSFPATIGELNSLRGDNIVQVVTLAANSPNLLKLDARKVMERLVRLRGKN